MISIYKKYHIAYWCIGIVEIIGMIIANLWFCRHTWVPAIPITAVTILLVLVDAFIFTKLTSKKLSNEVLPLFYNCQVHKYIEGCETTIKNAEFYMRIQQGNYEGAEEHYQKQLDTIKPLYPITEVSYSYALGKLLFLKGEPERARKYLQVAIDLGGDTKYKKFAEELLQKINSKNN